MKKIGEKTSLLKLSCFLLGLWILSFGNLWFAGAAEVQFEAQLQSQEISTGENLGLHFSIHTDSMRPSIDKPQFDAPDFDVVNQFNRGTSIESRYINGQFSTSRTEQFTSILLPKKKGRLKIKNIRVTVDGKVYHAADIDVLVGDAPAGATDLADEDDTEEPDPRSQITPRSGGAAVAKPQRGEQLLFLRTEPNKTRAYRGEQIILEYSLFSRTQIGSIQVERYPTASGFLKEDLDLTLLKNALQFVPRNINGVEYQRATMAKYAVFAVREGKLPLDVFSAKIAYRGVRGGTWGGDDDEDPFMLRRFFQNFQMMTETRSSDRREVEILPLPSQGKPDSFHGLVGQFDISATSDKPRLKVGEALNVKVKIEGTGHAGSLESLKVKWPDAFEQYEDKSQTKYHPNGTSERVFDFLLIPRQAGHFELPAIEISMFDPSSESYRVKASSPIIVDVDPGDGNAVTGVPGAAAPGKTDTSAPKVEFSAAQGTLEVKPPKNRGIFNVLALGFAILSGLFFLGSLIFAAAKLLRKEQRPVVDHKDFLKKIKSLENDFLKTASLDAVQADERKRLDALSVKLEEIFASWLRFRFGTSKGSLTRQELEDFLRTKDYPEELRIKVLKFAEELENVRFMPSQNRTLRESLLALVKTLQSLVQ